MGSNSWWWHLNWPCEFGILLVGSMSTCYRSKFLCASHNFMMGTIRDKLTRKHYLKKWLSCLCLFLPPTPFFSLAHYSIQLSYNLELCPYIFSGILLWAYLDIFSGLQKNLNFKSLCPHQLNYVGSKRRKISCSHNIPEQLFSTCICLASVAIK